MDGAASERDQNEFDDVKRIIKELLFNGADRTAIGSFNLNLLDEAKVSQFVTLTPLELLQEFENQLPRKEYESLFRILVRDSNYKNLL